MNRGQVFESRKKFVEEGIATILSAKSDFMYIKYARVGLTESEYIRIGDVFGKSVTLEITAMSLEDIVEDIAKIMLIGNEKISPPESIVTDKETLRKIALLFM